MPEWPCAARLSAMAIKKSPHASRHNELLTTSHMPAGQRHAHRRPSAARSSSINVLTISDGMTVQGSSEAAAGAGRLEAAGAETAEWLAGGCAGLNPAQRCALGQEASADGLQQALADIDAAAERVESAFNAIRAFEDAHPTIFKVTASTAVPCMRRACRASPSVSNPLHDPDARLPGYDCCHRSAESFAAAMQLIRRVDDHLSLAAISLETELHLHHVCRLCHLCTWSAGQSASIPSVTSHRT